MDEGESLSRPVQSPASCCLSCAAIATEKSDLRPGRAAQEEGPGRPPPAAPHRPPSAALPLAAAADAHTQALLGGHPKPSDKPKQTLGLANDAEEEDEFFGVSRPGGGPCRCRRRSARWSRIDCSLLLLPTPPPPPAGF